MARHSGLALVPIKGTILPRLPTKMLVEYERCQSRTARHFDKRMAESGNDFVIASHAPRGAGGHSLGEPPTRSRASDSLIVACDRSDHWEFALVLHPSDKYAHGTGSFP